MSEVGDVTPAGYAVLFHVYDTVVTNRASLAFWTAQHLPNNVPQDLSEEDCRQAIESLIGQGLLVELSAEDIDSDLAFWRNERRPVSWGVDRDRYVGDVDLTERGFQTMYALNPWPTGPAQGYCNEEPGVVHVLGETEDACRQHAEWVLRHLDGHPWHWPAGRATVEVIRPVGPWWCVRYLLIPTGFEIVIRR